MHDRDLTLVGGAIALVVLLLGLAGGGMMGGWGGMGHGMMGWGGYGISGWWGILWIVFWILVISGIVLVVYSLLRRGGTAGRTDEASRDRSLKILRERYTRGEITQEQYEEMRRTFE